MGEGSSAKMVQNVDPTREWRKSERTHIDFLPLADIANEPGEPEEPDEAEELGEPQDAEGSAGVQQLEARETIFVRVLTNNKEFGCFIQKKLYIKSYVSYASFPWLQW